MSLVFSLTRELEARKDLGAIAGRVGTVRPFLRVQFRASRLEF
ncbi:hypothetical protein [Laspinema palackyanum]